MNHDRRKFCVYSTAAAATLVTGQLSSSASESSLVESAVLHRQEKEHQICAFIKFIQELSFDELAETMAEQGFQGIEATIRPNGLIEPDDVPEKLPLLVAALEKRNINITVMTTRINTANAANELILKTAADLGITRYRTDYYRYDLKKPVLPQIESFRPLAEGLAKLNRKLGMTGIYQNHAGPKYLGSTMWDLNQLLNDIDPNEIGVAFDIRHAIASGGQSWPVFWNVIEQKVKAVYVKDFRWKGLQTENVPLGEGVLDPKFFKMIRSKGIHMPISLHVEYLQNAGLDKNVKALGDDLKTLHKFLGIDESE